MPGLYQQDGIWRIDKHIKGQRIRKSTGTGDYSKAEQILIALLNCSSKPISRIPTFDDSSAYYIQTEKKKSLDRDIQCLDNWVPLIGHMLINEIHQDSLQPAIEERLKKVKSSTVIRELSVVIRILNLAARTWRNENNEPWLAVAPLISLKNLRKMKDTRKPYPLTWDEQRKLFDKLPGYLQVMLLFKVNTGLRQQEVCGLLWNWEIPVSELDTSVFIIPENFVKNGEERLVMLNSAAKSIIDSQRGLHNDLVFHYQGKQLYRLNNKKWRKAWKDSGLPINGEVYRGVHNLKHTFGARLRAAGVVHETRQVLLGHKNRNITSHYSIAQLEELIKAADLVAHPHAIPTITVLNLKARRISN